MTLTRNQIQNLNIENTRMVFTVNLFREDINPGMAEGLRLFLSATKALDEDECFDLKMENTKALTDHLYQTSSTYGWNKLVDWVNMGTAAAPNYKNILDNGKEIKLEHVIKQAWNYYGNRSGTPVLDDKTIIDIDPENILAHRIYFYKQV